ncbi:exodeoxyribonuclease VII large subunit, partial [Candidatus Hydrogenedentota bacterium]
VVARAIFASEKPIISAVGHEIDFSISDFVADVRAPTPSAAAELVIGERDALVNTVNAHRARLAGAMDFFLSRSESLLERLRTSYVFARPDELLAEHAQRLDDGVETLERMGLEYVRLASERTAHLSETLRLVRPQNVIDRTRDQVIQVQRRMELGVNSCIEKARGRTGEKVAGLEALSPLAALARGFSQVTRGEDGVLVNDSSQVDVDDRILVRLHRGSLDCKVVKTVRDK